MVPHSPPQVIDIEGKGRREGIEAFVFLDWTRNYNEWWTTQTCGPLGGPIEAQVIFILFLKNICSFSLFFFLLV